MWRLQVSHHPPVSCWHATSDSGWEFYGEMELRSKFWGKTVEMSPAGTCFLQLGTTLYRCHRVAFPCIAALGFGVGAGVSDAKMESLPCSWNKAATMTIANIIFGQPYLDWHGEVVVKDHSSGAQPHIPALDAVLCCKLHKAQIVANCVLHTNRCIDNEKSNRLYSLAQGWRLLPKPFYY